ncbi:uracil-DNA glycosylase [Deinobacterium chartae]|uniref:Uracil-DNA glycosylase n=1 Tax=Deinobacterium chartae TaxID=521158 RepID=A0A841I2W2_9DEIO|nr:uracil-DNA glycosylase [Deinobacterium chartae]MBB6099396.1 uracil-DNA glycosylase [Deinobacterium chartae]
MNPFPPLPQSWQPALAAEFEQPYMNKLAEFLEAERATHTVFPPLEQTFSALEFTPLDQVEVMILGQDPYHGPGQAHGLAFSVRPGVRVPPSLVNIFRELNADLGVPVPNHGYLEAWARRGVLLLNTVLTVRAAQANSHKGKGWERFTDAVIRAVNERPERVVFVLWGAHAQKKASLIDTSRHAIVQSVHPSPLSASNGFFGSRPFSQVNALLREAGRPEIDWSLPQLDG